MAPSAEHSSDCSVFRAALRREKITARVMLDPVDHARRSAQIAARLEGLLSAHAPSTLAFCAAVRGEFDAEPLVTALVAQGWSAAMPVVETPDAPMVFRAWSPGCAMTTDRHGIPIPRDTARCDPDVVLIPLVAFDAAGYRLGYGGGYFDRTLAALSSRPQTIGVGFELARVADLRPQAHDIRLDAIVTEDGIFRS